ncbi:hypothetical protein DH2020_047266 [Rehmannia glutinosa]|uniref:beta-fructofuranosidase n=1 Tax=Rehmannia glutinosa TaxID=99300 RepID=A0ABR0U9T7_REHGL
MQNMAFREPCDNTFSNNINNAIPYAPLLDSTVVAEPPQRRRRRRSSSVVLLLMTGLLGVALIFAVVRFGIRHNEIGSRSSSLETRRPAEMIVPADRGVAEGVSLKTFGRLRGARAYSWTNNMLAWQRTAFHFQPRKNWMNGPVYYKGWYHFFYQYNPFGAVWGNIAWGHAVSRDLIHWRHLPIAMVPDHWYDINGVWTGSATILKDGQLVMLYTGSTNESVQVQNLAYPADPSDPLLVDWIKYPATRYWSRHMAWGQKISVTPPPHGVKHAVKTSLDDDRNDYYALGTYDGTTGKWTPDNPNIDVGIGLRYDYGIFYASKTFYDQEKKRRVLWGWIKETDSEAADIQKGWASLQAIPRTIVFDKKTGSNVLLWPVEEVERLRVNRKVFHKVKAKPGSVVSLDVGSTSQLDIMAEFEVDQEALSRINGTNMTYSCTTSNGAAQRGALGPFGILVHTDNDLTEQTPIYFYISKDSLGNLKTFFCADHSRSSEATDVNKAIYGSIVPVLKSEKLSVRILRAFPASAPELPATIQSIIVDVAKGVCFLLKHASDNTIAFEFVPRSGCEDKRDDGLSRHEKASWKSLSMQWAVRTTERGSGVILSYLHRFVEPNKGANDGDELGGRPG